MHILIIPNKRCAFLLHELSESHSLELLCRSIALLHAFFHLGSTGSFQLLILDRILLRIVCLNVKQERLSIERRPANKFL